MLVARSEAVKDMDSKAASQRKDMVHRIIDHEINHEELDKIDECLIIFDIKMILSLCVITDQKLKKEHM